MAKFTKLAAATLALCASLSACGGVRQVETRVEAAGAVVAPVASGTAAVAAKKAVHLCGAKTKAGGTCKRRVRAEGLRCWMHGGPGVEELDAAKSVTKE